MRPPILRLLVLLLLAAAPQTAMAEADDMEPPGDCTKEEHKTLKTAVGTACKSQPMKCFPSQDCATLLENLRRHHRCITARVAIMNKCYRGGNAMHKTEVANYREGAADCVDFIKAKSCLGGRDCK